MFEVRFMTLSGPFAEARRERFATLESATVAVAAYAAQHGFTSVKMIGLENDYEEGVRWTARSPGGRPGRNIAFADPIY